MAGMPYPPKNTTSIISGLRGYGRMPYPPNKRGAVETTAPPGDSGGIQTHDLQNFFSTKSFCSKNKKVQQTAETMAAWVWQGCHTLLIKEVQLRQLHPPGDSGGIQTHDLQNFFSTKSFCSKNKRGATSKGCTPW